MVRIWQKIYSSQKGKPHPSSIPIPDLHFFLLPHRHKLVAFRIAKTILAQTQPITSLKVSPVNG